MWLTKHWHIYLVSQIALPHGRAPSSLGSLTHDMVHLVFMSMAPSAADLVSQVAFTAMDLVSQVWLHQRKVTSVAPSAVDSLALGIALPLHNALRITICGAYAADSDSQVALTNMDLVSQVWLPQRKVTSVAPSAVDSLALGIALPLHNALRITICGAYAADSDSQVALTTMDLVSQVWLPQRKVTSVAPSAVDSLALGIALPLHNALRITICGAYAADSDSQVALTTMDLVSQVWLHQT